MESDKKLRIQALNEFHNLQTNFIPDERSSNVERVVGLNTTGRRTVYYFVK
jgi:hypothetical protein